MPTLSITVQVYQTIRQVAKSNVRVLITGETGTGKELCANAIHQNSQRHKKPYLICATIPHHLLESELFGHIKGAFTGANKNKQGIASIANGGTLFLDEIGELDFELQSKLLRFMENGTFYKVGSHQPTSVDIRFIAATNRDLQAEIQARRFRSELYHRLKTVVINLPPLRQRGQDVLLLAQHFLGQYAQQEQKHFKHFRPEAELLLLAFEWPGNVRQLQNVIHSLVVLNEGEIITAEMVLAALKEEPHEHKNTPTGSSLQSPVSAQANGSSSPQKPRPLRLVEKEAIEQAVDYYNGNVEKAAESLEISRGTVYNKSNKWKKQ